MAFGKLKFDTDFEGWLDKRLSSIKSQDKTVSDIRSRTDTDEGAQGHDEDWEEFGEFETHRAPTGRMSNPAAAKKSDSGNYYKSVWVGEDEEDWDGSLTSLDYNQGPRTRDLVAQILKETELPDEEQTVFTIPRSHKRETPAADSVANGSSFDERYRGSKPNAPPSGNSQQGGFDSLENLNSENGYVQISREKQFRRKSNKDYFDQESWSLDGENDESCPDGDRSGVPGSAYGGNPPRQCDSQTVRFRKYQADLHLEDNYIEDDDVLKAQHDDDLTTEQASSMSGQHPPIARAILPMESEMEMEMEIEDDVEMLDNNRNQEYTYEFRTDTASGTSDTQPIVHRLDQSELSLQHGGKLKRSKYLRLGLFVVVVMVCLGALIGIVYIILHFFR